MSKASPRSLFWFGFGLERLGLVALRWYRFFAFLVLLVSIAAVGLLPYLTFDGNTDNMVKSDRQAYTEYQSFRDAFPSAASSVTLHIRGGERPLISKRGLEDLVSFHIETSLLDNVEQVISPLSVQQYDSNRQRIEPVFPETFDTDQAARDAAQRAVDLVPEVAAFLSIHGDSALMVIVLADDENGSSQNHTQFFDDLDKLIAQSGLDVLKTGLATVRFELFTALVDDLIFVTLMGVVIGATIAFIVFRRWQIVLLANAPAVVSVLWTLGAMTALGSPINPLTTIIPIFAMILTFADGLHLLSHWLRRLSEGEESYGALREVITEVGPATALTSITTSLALISLALGGEPLYGLAFFGAATVMISYLSVIVVLPVLCRIMSGGIEQQSVVGLRIGKWIRPLANWTAFAVPRLIVGISVISVLGMLVIHAQFEASVDLSDHIPKASETHEAEVAISDDFGGSDPVYVLLPLPEGIEFSDLAARQIIVGAHEALEAKLGDGRVLSIAQLWRSIPAGENMPEELAHEIRRAPAVLSDDGRTVLISGMIKGLLPAGDVIEMYDQLTALPELRGASVTGPAVMTAIENSYVIQQLKLGMLLAAILAAGIVGLVCRSFRVFAGVFLANLLVVLMVETGVWATGRLADFALFVALTVAIGVGVDNAVHIVNLHLRRGQAVSSRESLRQVLDLVAPALTASTLVLSAYILVTQFSALPVVNFIGVAIAITLLLALVSNVVVLPATLVVSGRTSEKAEPTSREA